MNNAAAATTPAAPTVRQSIRDLYHDAAQRAGLVWVDGMGAYSIFEGNLEQWSALAAAVDAMPKSASVTAARKRIAWAVASVRA